MPKRKQTKTPMVSCRVCKKTFANSAAQLQHFRSKHEAAKTPVKSKQGGNVTTTTKTSGSSISTTRSGAARSPVSVSQARKEFNARATAFKGISREGSIACSNIFSSGEGSAKPARIPDGAAFDTLVQGYILPQFSISRPPFKLDGQPYDGPWQMSALLLPSAESPLFLKAWFGTTEPSWQEFFGINEWGTSVAVLPEQSAYFMAVFQPQLTSLSPSNVGTYTSPFRDATYYTLSGATPPVLQATHLSSVSASRMNLSINRYRVTAMSAVFTNTTKVVDMGGQISGVQLGRNLCLQNKSVSAVVGSSEGTTVPACSGYFLADINENSQAILASNPNMFDCAASEGHYMCLYPNGNEFDFTDAEQMRGVLCTRVDTTADSVTNDWAPVYIATTQSGGFITQGKPLITTMDDKWNVGFLHFHNLTTATTFNLKLKCFIECVPDPDGVLSASTGVRPSYDPKALDLMRRACTELPSSWPASANSGNDILEFLGGFWKGFKSVFEPGVEMIGKAVKAFI